ncbi:hypothetical protein [Leclercia adecarboxylata]|uniref:hypothetical protein n=1 Tax=Leclercia adecarboxylata TaxID=83655 RepID=UPI0021F190F9|nr:hypothetical protein [Leclercia adecarboxylata]UYM56779.1 hypothetical protein N5937_05615 [Leclercia adecarboxylata]
MAQNNQQLVFNINGNATGLQRALATAGNSLNSFSTQAGGSLAGLAGNFGSLTGQIGTMNTGVLALAGGFGALTAVVASQVNTASDYVKVLNDASYSSGITVEQLQKLQGAFAGLNIEYDKFSDFNKDALDHMGDFFREGKGGFGDDLKSWGVNLQGFTKYMNDADGGIKMIIKTFYELQKAGKSNAEITNAMESIASDSSKLLPVLKQYKSEVEAIAAIEKQHVGITTETAQAYALYQQNIAQLDRNFQEFRVNALLPVIEALNELRNIFAGDWNFPSFDQMGANLKRFAYDFTSLGNHHALPDSWGQGQYSNSAMPKTEPTKPGSTKPYVLRDPDGEKKAADAAKALVQKQVQARINLNQVMSQLGRNEAETRVLQYNYTQNELRKKMEESLNTLNLNESQKNNIVSRYEQARLEGSKRIITEMLEAIEPKQLSENLAALSIGNVQNITPEHIQKMLSAQDVRSGLHDPNNVFGNQVDIKAQQDELYKQRDFEIQVDQQLYADKLISKEQFEKRKAELTARYNNKAAAVERQNSQLQIQTFADTATSIGTMLEGVAGKGNKAAQAAFIVGKSISIANIVMKIQEALANAMATPWPANFANYAQVASLGASIISTARGTQIQGQAHSGIDSVPKLGGRDESTWILKAGERVVNNNTNRDLTQFLKQQDKPENSGTGQNVINAPLIVNGGGQITDAQFKTMLQKHSNNVMQAVRAAQTRST